MMGHYGPKPPHMAREGRMRKALSSYEECAQFWARQLQIEGRAGNGRMYFVGPTIYSYGSHFPMGHIVRNKDSGANICLLNDTSYSPTTSRHQRVARSAAHSEFGEAAVYHMPTNAIRSFMDLQPLVACSVLFTIDRERASDSLNKSYAARTKRGEHMLEALKHLQHSNRIAAFFGMKRPFALDMDTAPEAVQFALALSGDQIIVADYFVKTELLRKP